MPLKLPTFKEYISKELKDKKFGKIYEKEGQKLQKIDRLIRIKISLKNLLAKINQSNIHPEEDFGATFGEKLVIMSDNEKYDNITWGLDTQKKFDLMLAKIPVFLRDMAHKKVLQKAMDLTQKDGRTIVSEKDMVDAFFAATPFGFHGPMKNDMDDLKIDYQKYGHSK